MVKPYLDETNGETRRLKQTFYFLQKFKHFLLINQEICFTIIIICFLALAIHVRSPAAYSALKSFKILELPSIKSLLLFTAVRNHESGIDEDYLAEKKAGYILFSEECVKNGSKKPLGIGAIIFDEVKVIGKVALNMKNEKFLGLAMNEEEMHNLHDVFQPFSQPTLYQLNIFYSFFGEISLPVMTSLVPILA